MQINKELRINVIQLNVCDSHTVVLMALGCDDDSGFFLFYFRVTIAVCNACDACAQWQRRRKHARSGNSRNDWVLMSACSRSFRTWINGVCIGKWLMMADGLAGLWKVSLDWSKRHSIYSERNAPRRSIAIAGYLQFRYRFPLARGCPSAQWRAMRLPATNASPAAACLPFVDCAY